MAGQIPDPRALNSWEDAFQYPLPAVRKLEQQLRKNIDDNRQKLRSLVGASYRDLLGTAERIVEMDRQMETVETYVGDIGRKCNARTVAMIAENHAHMRKTMDARDGEKYRAMAQTKVLQSALTMVLRIIKAGGDALQASKLFVLSRLLHKSVSEGSHAPSVIEELQRKLMALRKKLLAHIDRVMVKPSEDKTLQAHTLCAYALVTSSTPKEVLRHFLQVRYEQLVGKSDAPSETDMLQILDLYSQTLLDTRDLFPRRFAESLSQLAKVPLLRDEQVHSVFELNIDIYGMWIAEDVRTFTPWVRHDQIATAEVSAALESWSSQAQECLLDGLRDYLKDQDNARAVVETRQKVLSKYMSLSSKLRNDAHGEAVYQLRDAFLERLEELAAKAASTINLTLDESDISRLVERNSEPQRMWELAKDDLDLSHGALKFRQSVVQNRHSRTAALQGETEKLDEWIKRINDILDLADAMRTSKWDNDFDFDLDDLNDSDALLQTLSRDDPERLQRRLRESTEATLADITDKVTSAAAETKHAAFYVRLRREVDQRRRALEARLRIRSNQVTLSVLHRNLANSVSKSVIEGYVQSAKVKNRAATALWDGSPPLPIQPSPTAFRFLKALHQAMSDAGTDLWSPHAVFEMKGIILDELGVQLDDHHFTHLLPDSTLTNGHVEADQKGGNDSETMPNGTDVAKATRRDWLVQNLFDVHYLRRIFYRPDHDKPDLGALGGVARVIGQQLELDDALNERLRKSANEYWKRTYLLFGLLASGGGEVRE